MGVKINKEEAVLLVACADQDKSNDLNMNQFMNLIFEDNAVLNNQALYRLEKEKLQKNPNLPDQDF